MSLTFIQDKESVPVPRVKVPSLNVFKNNFAPGFVLIPAGEDNSPVGWINNDKFNTVLVMRGEWFTADEYAAVLLQFDTILVESTGSYEETESEKGLVKVYDYKPVMTFPGIEESSLISISKQIKVQGYQVASLTVGNTGFKLQNVGVAKICREFDIDAITFWKWIANNLCNAANSTQTATDAFEAYDDLENYAPTEVTAPVSTPASVSKETTAPVTAPVTVPVTAPTSVSNEVTVPATVPATVPVTAPNSVSNEATVPVSAPASVSNEVIVPAIVPVSAPSSVSNEVTVPVIIKKKVKVKKTKIIKTNDEPEVLEASAQVNTVVSTATATATATVTNVEAKQDVTVLEVVDNGLSSKKTSSTNTNDFDLDQLHALLCLAQLEIQLFKLNRDKLELLARANRSTVTIDEKAYDKALQKLTLESDKAQNDLFGAEILRKISLL